MRGEVTVAPFDSHRPLQRLKVAALLALLESRWNVSEEDWQLAEVFVANSDAVRDALLVYARTEAAKEKERKVAEQVDVAVRTAAEVTQIPAAVERVARNIARRVHAAEAAVCSRGDVRRAQKSSDRKFVDAAIDFAEQRGWLRAEDTMLAAGGSRPS
jgi:primosomal protein N'